MGQQNTRQVSVDENVTVGTIFTASKRIVFEEYALGAVFVPAAVSGSILWWGGAQDDPSGAQNYPVNATSLLSGNYAPIINAAGSQVTQNVSGGASGQWYPIPAECSAFGLLKITSSTVTNVAVVLKS